MTQLLEKAFKQASLLSDEEQDTIATIMFEEFLAESKWENLLNNHPEVMEKLAHEAREDIRNGETTPLEFGV